MIWKKRPTETDIAALSSNLGGYLPSEWVGNITDISQLNSLTIPGKYLRYITNGVGGLPGGWGVVEVAALNGYDNYFQTVTFVNGYLYARSHPTNGEWTSFASLISKFATIVDSADHVVANVNAVRNLLKTTADTMVNEEARIMTIVHTDSSETVAPLPHLRYTGTMVKDAGGNTIRWTATNRTGQLIVMSYDGATSTWTTYYNQLTTR